VVIITTKKGKAGKPTINFNAYTGTSQTIKTLDVLGAQEWYSLRREAYLNSGQTSFNATQLSLNDMGRRPANFASLTETDLLAIANALPTYDWQDEAFSTGKVQNYEVSFSGGDEKNKYYISTSYNRQDALLP
jgi:hypothetical protein